MSGQQESNADALGPILLVVMLLMAIGAMFNACTTGIQAEEDCIARGGVYEHKLRECMDPSVYKK